MIRTKRVYDVPDKLDGLRILVDRVWPRGLSKERAAVDIWLKDLAPSSELRKWFGHELGKWPVFKREYHRHLGQARFAEALNEIRAHGRGNTVTLLFAARDVDHNNAVALQEFLRR